jgi:tape measure domain-containing protein
VSVVANVAINVDSRNAVSKLRQVQQGAQQTERAVGGLGAAIGKLAVAFAGVQAIKFVFTQAAQLQTQARSLEILAGSAEKAGKIIKELQDLGAITPFTSTELIDSAKRLQAFGVETEKVVETTRRLADASGATGAELSGLVTAYGQVQAKGRLQGEELLQFQERGIALQEELRKMYGMTGEEFQKALSKGQVSAKAVEVALINLTNAGGKYANGAIAQSDTLNGKLSTLQDSFQRLAQNIGTFFEPVFKFLIDGINAFLDRVNNGLRVSAQLKANEQAAIQTRQKFGGFRAANPFDQEAQQFEENLRQSLLKSALSTGRGAAPKAPTPAPATPGLLNAATAGGGARGGGGRAAGGGADKAANDAKRAAEQAAQAEQQIQERLRGLTREIELNAQISTIKELQFQAEMDGNKELQARLQGEERIIQIMQSTAQSLDGITDQRLQQKILAKAEGEIASARQETALEMQRIDTERTKSFNEIIAGLDLELALKTATTEQAREQLRLEAEIAKLKGQGFTPEQIGTIAAKKTELAAPKTDQQNITEKIATLKKEITDLTSISNIAITAAEGIGNAFAQSFQGLISGSMTAKEALGSFFKSVADMFLEMAAQIIAKQITMIILQTILKALGAVAGGGGNAASALGSNPNVAAYAPLAKGGTFGNGVAAFAKGGTFSNSIVSSPTLFKFADGGTTRTGLMGEAGPEAIMPLKRGADGSLGVQANGLREAMGRPPGGANGSPVLNMSFQSTSINGVEYVSRDQLESAMAETRRASTRDGAKRGMTMTLDRIQNSSSTRRKVGI